MNADLKPKVKVDIEPFQDLAGAPKPYVPDPAPAPTVKVEPQQQIAAPSQCDFAQMIDPDSVMLGVGVGIILGAILVSAFSNSAVIEDAD